MAGDDDEGRIWVGGLPEKITEEDLKEEYGKFGPIDHLQIRFNTGKCSFAFIKYEVPDDAVKAMKETDQKKLFGMPFIKVAWSGPRSGKGGGKGGKGKRSRSPRRRSRSGPRRRSPSRRRRSPSRRRRSPSRRRSRSRRRSPTPRRRSPTPRRRSPTPRRRSPSPKRGSPSPKRRSRSTRRRSPSAKRSTSPKQRGASPRRRSVSSSKKFCIIIENLPKDMDSQELKALASDFAKVGKVASAKVLGDGKGELEYTEKDDMDGAINKLHKRKFAGSDDRLSAVQKS